MARPTGTALAILVAVASMRTNLGETTVERSMLPILTGKAEQTIKNSLSSLKKSGFMDVDRDVVRITPLGMDQLIPEDFGNFEAPTSNQKLYDYLADKHKLTRKEILLIDTMSCGRTFRREDVAKAIGCSFNQTFKNLQSRLRKIGVLEYVDAESIRLTDRMFPITSRVE